jgi:hypothetical protein
MHLTPLKMFLELKGGRKAHKGDNLSTICELSFVEHLGASMSHKYTGFRGQLQGLG